jgi:GNAT superfamily N-acetyltransferase
VRRCYPLFAKGGRVAVADLSPRGRKRFCLTRIKVEAGFRGHGYGRELLGSVLSDADREGVTLVLDINAYVGSPLSDEQLALWYKRNGFQQTNESGRLIRYPKRRRK